MLAALRPLIKTPWFSLVIVVSLAAGIGANVAIFSWLSGALVKPLPAVSHEVMEIVAHNRVDNDVGVSWLDSQDLRERLPSLDLILQRPRALNLGDSGRDERVWGEFVSENFFTTLGVTRGRGQLSRQRAGRDPLRRFLAPTVRRLSCGPGPNAATQ